MIWSSFDEQEAMVAISLGLRKGMASMLGSP